MSSNKNNHGVKSLGSYTITVSSELTPEQLSAFDQGGRITLNSASGETIDLIIEDLEVNGIEWIDEEKNVDEFHIPLNE